MEIEPLIRELESEESTDAVQLVEKAARLLIAFSGGWPAEDGADLQKGLAEAGRRMLAARPTLGPLFHLLTQLYALAGEPADIMKIRKSIRSAAVDFTTELQTRADKLAAQTATLFGTASRVMVLGSPQSVRRALSLAVEQGTFAGATIGEGRPGRSSREMARELAQAGAVNLRLVSEAALPSLLGETDLVLVTAMTIRAVGALVPVGAAGLTAVAKEMNKPVHLVGGVLKLLPESELLGGPPPLGPPGDLWVDAPEGVLVLNHRAETVPLAAFKGVVQEGGVVPSFEVEKRVREMPVPGWIDGSGD
jgi:translation initiation factor 2B subunit (eIF-2B alpha/beta/delta family)